MSLTSKISLALGLMTGLGLSFVAPVVFQPEGFALLYRPGYANAQAPAQTFADVPADHWAHDYIEALAKSNIVSGFGDRTFKPNDPVTRAEFAAILDRAFLLSSQPITVQPLFTDVPANYWATDAILAARSAGFLSGYPDNTFKPNDRIVRVQTLVSLANGLKYPAGDPQSLSNYKDADTVPAYARPSIATAAQANLIVSYPAPDQISPNRSASRAEVVAFVYQALVKAGRIDPIAVKPERRWQITPITTIAAEAYRMSLSGNGQRLAAITDLGQNIKIWNTQTGSLLRTVIPEEPDSVFTEVAISQDGTKIAAIKRILPTGARQLTVQSVEDGRVLIDKPLNPSQRTNDLTETDLSYVVFSPDDRQVITQVAVRDTQTAPDLYSNIINKRLDFQDIATGEVTQPIDLLNTEGIAGPTFSPDGRLLAGLYGNNDNNDNDLKTIGIWRRNQNNRFDYLMALPASKDGFLVSGITFTNSNLLNLTMVKNDETRLDTWNPQTGEQVQSTTLPDEKCLQQADILPSPDGTSYFSSYPDLPACLGNIQTREFQKNLDGLLLVSASVFSGDGDTIAVVGDREIRIFTKAAP